jgi:restriction system protein
MGRRSSVWKQLQRERERRRKAARQANRKHEQLIRQAQQARQQAEKRKVRADAAERRRQEELAHEAGVQEAAARTSEVESQVSEVETLLVASLRTQPEIDFAALRKAYEPSPFAPGALGQPSPAPQWENFEPPPPGPLGGLLGGRARYERERAGATQRFEGAKREHRDGEGQRLRALEKALNSYDAQVTELRKEAQAVDALERDFRAGVPDAVEEYFHLVLSQSPYPEDFPEQYRVAYRPEPRELVVECDLPTRDVIPKVRGYKICQKPQGDR